MKKLLLAFLVIGCGGVDPSRLESCGDHCRVFPETAVDSSVKPYLRETSPGFLCVPDRDISYGGYWAVPCASAFGYEGRCLGACIPKLKEYARLLPVDVCDPGEVCAPCYSPIDETDTGACRINGDYPRHPKP